MARKRIECGPPVELSTAYLKRYVAQRCHICRDCGEKTHWPGAQNPSGVYPIKINGNTISVRRLVLMLHDVKLRKNWKVISECENHRCINLKTLRQVSMKHIVREAVRDGKLMTPLIRAKIAATRRQTVGKITQEAAEIIKLDPRVSDVIAAEHGISGSYVRAMKGGRARLDYSANPLKGLGVR